jgi:RND superfamily putative drug exporter
LRINFSLLARRIVQFIKRFLTPRTIAIVLVVLGFATIGAISAGIRHVSAVNASGTTIPKSFESYKAAERDAALGAPPASSALVVFEKSSKLNAQDKALIENKIGVLGIYAPNPFLPPVRYSQDGKAALQVVPLIQTDALALINTRVTSIRQMAAKDLPANIKSYVSGPEGFANDLAHVFDGADIKLLIATGLVVMVLLLVTYRSPILWLIPLFVVACEADSAGMVARVVSNAFGITPDASVNGILSVLVFGVGTDYALLLISRYREELLKQADRFQAMRRAWIGAAPAIVASATTVILALLTLLLAQTQGTRALGIACATGVLLTLILSLTWLPACLVIFGRWVFWPLVPRLGAVDKSLTGTWSKLGTWVSKKPRLIAASGFLVLVALACGSLGLKIGLSSTQQFLAKPEAVVGQEVLAKHFGAGLGSPILIMTNTAAVDQVSAVAQRTPGVALVSKGQADDQVTEVFATIKYAPQTEESFRVVQQLRDRLHRVPGANALVGGIDAAALDVRSAQVLDQDLIIPLILAIVFLVLLVLLRSVLAPVLLLLTVVASFFASLGAGWLVFQHVFHFPALANSTLLLSFLFLVALGVDYNIFLATRALEESKTLGVKQGMIRALGSTGGVITSAGVLLAAVFAVLGVLPLIALTQVGAIVCIGVLLDTLLVRTVIVPALAFLSGRNFWWPNGKMLSD